MTRCLANLLVVADCRQELIKADGLAVLLRACPSSEALAARGESDESGELSAAAVARALANITFDPQMAGLAVRSQPGLLRV